ncbi:hypothetical protein CEXT_350871 [Caerostris extrusa]|uniref:Uncharacterized protein n=1 Tax=Caerostris extrusa TaxID=172846 RepID=A0AAV4QL56_CAEEX|nr:hypothetical protein CEXT_350871 [Caerostris extrusa]
MDSKLLFHKVRNTTERPDSQLASTLDFIVNTTCCSFEKLERPIPQLRPPSPTRPGTAHSGPPLGHRRSKGDAAKIIPSDRALLNNGPQGTPQLFLSYQARAPLSGPLPQFTYGPEWSLAEGPPRDPFSLREEGGSEFVDWDAGAWHFDKTNEAIARNPSPLPLQRSQKPEIHEERM